MKSVSRTTRGDTVTHGGLATNVWTLTWPNVISQLLFMLPGVYDAVWLGRLGHTAQAAAGLATSVRLTMVSVLMSLSLSSGAVVARYVGAREQEKADRAAMQAVILMVLASGSLGAVGFVFSRPLMLLAGADADVLPLAVRYARILFAGLVAMELVPSVGFMLNGAGAPRVMMQMTFCSMATLLVGEPLLVNWLGLEGAVLAVVLSNVAGMCWGLGVLVAGKTTVHVNLRHLRLDWSMMGRILRVALPGIVQRGAPNLAMSVLMRLIAAQGAPTLAAWTVTQRIFNLVMIPSLGLSRATPAMVGQNLGAERPERAERAVYLIARLVMLIGGGLVGLLALCAPLIIPLFSSDVETAAIGVYLLRILGLGYLALNVNYVFDAALSGAGDTVSPMTLNLLSLWLVQIPLAYWLSRGVGWGANGIWLGLSLGWVLQMGLMWLRFRQGRWKVYKI